MIKKSTKLSSESAGTFDLLMCVAVPGIMLHSGSSAQGSQGSSDPPCHLGESHRLQLFLAVGMENTSVPQGYPQYIPSPSTPTHPIFISLVLPFIQHPSPQHSLSRSIVYCKTDIKVYVSVEAISLQNGFPVIVLPDVSPGATAL